MNETPKNRRLQVMPEVLPAPTITKSGASSSVRNQTLSHMQRLLATVAAIPLASCTRTDTQGTQTVTIPSASTSTAQDTSTATQGSLLPPPTNTAPTAKPTATAPDMGYAVVDPMPAPARCMGLAAASKASATFKKQGGTLVLEFTFTLPTSGPSWTGTTFQAGQKPGSWAGTMVSSRVVGATMIVTVNVSPGSTSSGVSIPIDCAAGVGSVGINASFTTVAENAKVTLSLHDF
jgi:hypothetical protein